VIEYISEASEEGLTLQGVKLIAMQVAILVFERLGNSHKDRLKNISSVRAKNLIRAVVYDKITTVSVASSKDYGEGQIMSLLSRDAQQAEELFHIVAAGVHMVINVSVTATYLGYFFGASFIIAAALAATVLILNNNFAAKLKAIAV
jgi:ABC-type transport system involved in cytochrome bd biosynthesis fused ATPase/permease subunit